MFPAFQNTMRPHVARCLRGSGCGFRSVSRIAREYGNIPGRGLMHGVTDAGSVDDSVRGWYTRSEEAAGAQLKRKQSPRAYRRWVFVQLRRRINLFTRVEGLGRKKTRLEY